MMKHVIYIGAAFLALSIAATSCAGGGRPTAKAAAGTTTNAETGITTGAATKGIGAQSAASGITPAQAVEYGFRVVKEFPHDTHAYTQGLLWHDGWLYEGTGQNGASELRRVDLATGKVVQNTKLERKYFGEGIALLGDRIYQLTWTGGRAFVYDATTFRQVRSFSYDGEGWGLTTDGERLYMSNGSSTIAVRDATTFAVERTMQVTHNGRPVDNLNELEWIDGEIWANVYLTEQVMRIDPTTGCVTGIIDFTGIRSAADRTPYSDVFNGIACDAATGRIYVTGKLWNKLYQVEVFRKE